MIFFGKVVSYLVYLGQGEDFKLTTELSEKVQYPHNQAIKNELNEAILLQEQRLNSVKRGFEFLTRNQQKYPSLRACWRVNKHGDPIFLLHFFNVHIMNVDYAKFQKKIWSWNNFKGITLTLVTDTSH